MFPLLVSGSNAAASCSRGSPTRSDSRLGLLSGRPRRIAAEREDIPDPALARLLDDGLQFRASGIHAGEVHHRGELVLALDAVDLPANAELRRRLGKLGRQLADLGPSTRLDGVSDLVLADYGLDMATG